VLLNVTETLLVPAVCDQWLRRGPVVLGAAE